MNNHAGWDLDGRCVLCGADEATGDCDPREKIDAAYRTVVDFAKKLNARDALVRELAEALEFIEKWELPKVWAEDLGRYISYGFARGSNGERDYMRATARAALAKVPKEWSPRDADEKPHDDDCVENPCSLCRMFEMDGDK